MLVLTDYNISSKLLQQAQQEIPNIDFKFTLNEPTGNFFYDPWEIKSEFKGTVWEEILNSIPVVKGEARLIRLAPGTCYWSHADIDDRWHLSIINESSYLVDLSTKLLHCTELGRWYDMDAGRLHSAVNFGGGDRIQLVIRHLLNKGKFDDFKFITITPIKNVANLRYLFDKIYSPWLNSVNKLNGLREFQYTDTVTFIVRHEFIDSLTKLDNEYFRVTLQ